MLFGTPPKVSEHKMFLLVSLKRIILPLTYYAKVVKSKALKTTQPYNSYAIMLLFEDVTCVREFNEITIL